ncbi:MAG: SURF1 family protein [Acidimicrobiia bacterium]
MTNPLTRPRWLAGHALALVTVVAFVSLGFWQLRRHAEVQGLQAAVAEASALSAVDVAEAEAEFYHRVYAAGVFDHEREVRVLRSEGGESGERVITPLVLSDGTAILIDRGWVPRGGGRTRPSEATRVEGYLWPAERGSWVPESLGTRQLVRRIDPAVVQPFVDYQILDGYLIEAGPTAEPPSISSGPHLSYAVQWFLFTGVVLVGYPLLLRRALRRERLADAPPGCR